MPTATHNSISNSYYIYQKFIISLKLYTTSKYSNIGQIYTFIIHSFNEIFYCFIYFLISTCKPKYKACVLEKKVPKRNIKWPFSQSSFQVLDKISLFTLKEILNKLLYATEFPHGQVRSSFQFLYKTKNTITALLFYCTEFSHQFTHINELARALNVCLLTSCTYVCRYACVDCT